MTRLIEITVDGTDAARGGLALLAKSGYTFPPTAGRREPDATTRWYEQPALDLGSKPIELLPGLSVTPGQPVRLTVEPCPAPRWLMAWLLRGRPLAVQREMEAAA